MDEYPAAHPNNELKDVLYLQEQPILIAVVLNNPIMYCVEPASTQRQVAQIVDKDDEYADQPVVH